MTVPLTIIPIAATQMFQLPHHVADSAFASRFLDDQEAGRSDHDLLAESAGRACYEAWELKNPSTVENQGYLANIIDHGHFSVLEHASVTFYVAGVSRSLLAELTRHRHLSFSVRSQRYVDEGRAEHVTPPILEDNDDLAVRVAHMQGFAWHAYKEIYDGLRAQGVPVKQAREAARAVLPSATETRFFVTGNHRAYRDVLAKRNSPHADREIHRFAGELLRHLKAIAPNTYQDME